MNKTKSYSHCYIFENIEDISDALFSQFLEKVSAKRREKALSFVNTLDQRLSVMAELLLLHALKREGFHEGLPNISEGPYGKPYFEEFPSLHFNISHCPKSIACAISNTPIGVDVEHVGSFAWDVAKITLNKSEFAKVCAANSPELEFLHYWTRKESYLKLKGLGLCNNLPSLLINIKDVHFQTIDYPRGYTCSICTDDNHICQAPILMPLESLLI